MFLVNFDIILQNKLAKIILMVLILDKHLPQIAKDLAGQLRTQANSLEYQDGIYSLNPALAEQTRKLGAEISQVLPEFKLMEIPGIGPVPDISTVMEIFKSGRAEQDTLKKILNVLVNVVKSTGDLIVGRIKSYSIQQERVIAGMAREGLQLGEDGPLLTVNDHEETKDRNATTFKLSFNDQTSLSVSVDHGLPTQYQISLSKPKVEDSEDDDNVERAFNFSSISWGTQDSNEHVDIALNPEADSKYEINTSDDSYSIAGDIAFNQGLIIPADFNEAAAISKALHKSKELSK